MRRLPRAYWIAIVAAGILTILGSVMGNIGATALTWLSPRVAFVLFVLISLSLIGVSLWQEKQKAAPEPSATNARENREIMLGRVQNKWIASFLENPLYYSYDEQLLPLPLRERVGSRFDLVLSNPLEPAQTIPSGTTITQVFDQTGGELLILGEPGAGKTTLLLELARDLLKRAKDNEAAPIPVVHMLSSWATRKLPLEQWIVGELRMKYDIPSQIGEEWVKANQLLLLLDGLDEVTPDALPACIEAINEYYRQAHRSLVVCSRKEEYLHQPGRLALHTAVAVQHLSSEQVGTYLDDLAAKGEEIEGLKLALDQSETLKALATTPLFLTVLILAYHGKPVQELLTLEKAAPKDQPHLLFHNYVEKMLQRKGTRIYAPAQQTRHWLACLAMQLTAHQQSELYLEQLQLDWLPKRRRAFCQWSIGLATGLLGGLGGFGLGAGLFAGLVFGLGATVQHYTLRFWLWQAKYTPASWRNIAFLEDAVEQLLLRKVGGGYIFRHLLLQDYFASLDVVPHGSIYPGATTPIESRHRQISQQSYQPMQQQPIEPKNGLAIAGFICGFIGLLTSGWWFVGALFCILGIILSAVGMRRKGASGKEVATGGLVVSIIGVVLAVTFIVIAHLPS